MSIKPLFLFSLGILLAAAVGFVVVWRGAAPSGTPAPPGELPRVGERESDSPGRARAGGSIAPPTIASGPAFGEDSGAAFEPQVPAAIGSPIFEFVRRSPLLAPALPLLPRPSLAPTPPPLVPPPAPAAGGSTPLTDQEIFNRIWPSSYLGYLKGLERLEIRDGVIQAMDPGSIIRFSAAPRISSEFDEEDPIMNWFIPPGERHAIFTTDQDVYDSFLTTLEQAHANGWITGEEFERAVRSIREVLPPLIERERENLRRGVPSSFTLPRDQRFSHATSVRKLVRDLLDGIGYVLLLAEPAAAGWTTAPDCYKDDDPSNQSLGGNTPVFCCNCGIVFVCGKGGCFPVFVPDCGPQSAICDVPLGCLNLICQNTPNAIWDPQTFICGCG